MDIGWRVKVALAETRIVVLGTQILIGFQFRAVFEEGFERLPTGSRYLDGLATLLMLVALALLILPGSFHRLVEEGNDSLDFQRLVGLLASLALVPFAASLGVDVYVASERIVDFAGAIAAVVALGGLAALSWYGFGAWRRRSTGKVERAMTQRHKNEVERPRLEEKIDQMLTEARVVLPGAQALLGFQLAIVLTDGFEKLPAGLKLIHGAALIFVALAIILLMTPAPYHRIVYGGEASDAFHRIGSRLVTVSTIPLALALGADVFVVGIKITASPLISGSAALAVLALLIGFWHALPLLARYRRNRGKTPRLIGNDQARLRRPAV